MRFPGKQRAVRIFGLSAFPEMRLTVSFALLILCVLFGALEQFPKDFLLFRSTANLATVIIQRTFSPQH